MFIYLSDKISTTSNTYKHWFVLNITKVIRIFETFAGIGAQHKAIRNIKGNFKVVKTSEWDVRAMISYASIHHNKKFKTKINDVKTWTQKQIDDYLKGKVFSLNSKTPGRLERKHRDFQNVVIAADIVNNNRSNIMDVKGSELKEIDLLTYSFPCQGLSIANMGRDKGIKEDSNSTSNLIWQIKRILSEAKQEKIDLPKYLLMENVKNLIGPKHREDYDSWLDYLESIGYKTQTFVLNGLKHGSLQRRERVFAISVKDDKFDWSGICETKTKREVLKELIYKDKKISKELTTQERKIKYFNILNSSIDRDEIFSATPNDTPSRVMMLNENHKLLTRTWSKGYEYTFNTLTTKQDRHPNIGMIPLLSSEAFKDKLPGRFITNREAYQIMGFTQKDFDNVKPYLDMNILTKESLYRQAGNSIVVSVLEDIFKYIERIEKGE